MRKKLKKALIIVGSACLFLILIVVIAALLFFYQKPFIKGIVEKQLAKRTGIQITIGTLDYKLFPLRVEAGEITFAAKLDETEVDVFIEKLVLSGNIHRIRKKARPYFEAIEGEGVRIVSYVKKARKKIAIEDMLHALSSGMSYVRKIRLKNSFFEFIFSRKRMTLQGVDFVLLPSGSPESFAYSLTCRNVDGLIQPEKYMFQTFIQGSGTLSLKKTPSIDGRFTFRANHITLAEKKTHFEEIYLSLNGEFDPDKNTLTFPTLEIDLPSYINLSSLMSTISLDDLTFHLRPRIEINDLNWFFSLVKEYAPYQLDELELNGSAFFKGEARIFPNLSKQKAIVSGTLVLNATDIKYRTSGDLLDCRLSGSFRINDFPDNQDFSGRLKIYKNSFSGKLFDAQGISLDIPIVFKRAESRLNMSRFTGHLKTMVIDIQDRKFEMDDIDFQGQAFIDLKKREIQLSQAIIQLAPFPQIHLEVQAGLNSQDLKSISVRSSQMSFQSLLDFFSPFIPQNITELEPDGILDFQIVARNHPQEKDKAWMVSAKLEASRMNFHDPTFTVAGEALQPNFIFEGTFRRPFKNIPFAVKLELSQGETLWRDFYINWTETPIQGNISGQFQTSQKRLTDLSLDASIPDFGRITGTGDLDLQEPRSVDLKVTASELQLASLYSFISQRRTDSQPQAKLKGEAECRVELEGDKNSFSIRGHLKIRDASWTSGDKNFSIQRIDAHLPLFYERNSEPTESKVNAAEQGYLNLQKLHSTYLDMDTLRLDLSVQRNGYIIEPYELEIFGSIASIGKTTLEFGSNPLSFKSHASFFWRDGNLSQLPVQSKQFQFQGKFSVDLPKVEISLDHIYTEGQCKLEAFGGTIDINNIQVDQPFSKSRTTSCDVKLSGLNLEKITDSIPFGRVTGIINGEIKDLAFSYGQPERFFIHIESEKKKGMPQRFSLKATNDLAILGTGEKTPFSPQSGWTRLVKEFRYNKIGIFCSLKNDIFSLRGTIHKEGIEYLVKGSGLFAINVVNKQARNQIRFKDMLSRLKRIGHTKQSQ